MRTLNSCVMNASHGSPTYPQASTCIRVTAVTLHVSIRRAFHWCALHHRKEAHVDFVISELRHTPSEAHAKQLKSMSRGERKRASMDAQSHSSVFASLRLEPSVIKFAPSKAFPHAPPPAAAGMRSTRG